jgi:hypothetical protein
VTGSRHDSAVLSEVVAVIVRREDHSEGRRDYLVLAQTATNEQIVLNGLGGGNQEKQERLAEALRVFLGLEQR